MNYKDILGWMMDSELDIIAELARRIPKNGVAIEVGSMFGRSAACWATHAPDSAIIYCIDSWHSCYTQEHSYSVEVCLQNKFPISGKQYNLLAEFTNNTKFFPNIKMIQGHCPSQTLWDNINIDLFFLDAGHTNPNDWEIIEYFLPFIKSGGIICGHDYHENNFPDVVENVSKLEKMFNNKAILFEDSLIWMINKNG